MFSVCWIVFFQRHSKQEMEGLKNIAYGIWVFIAVVWKVSEWEDKNDKIAKPDFQMTSVSKNWKKHWELANKRLPSS